LFDPTLLLLLLRVCVGGRRYDFGTHSRLAETVPMYGASVVVLEGLFVFCIPELRELIDLKVFVDEDDDTRLARRVK
jgi:uridine kinase